MKYMGLKANLIAKFTVNQVLNDKIESLFKKIENKKVVYKFHNRYRLGRKFIDRNKKAQHYLRLFYKALVFGAAISSLNFAFSKTALAQELTENGQELVDEKLPHIIDSIDDVSQNYTDRNCAELCKNLWQAFNETVNEIITDMLEVTYNCYKYLTNPAWVIVRFYNNPIRTSVEAIVIFIGSYLGLRYGVSLVFRYFRNLGKKRAKNKKNK